MKEKNKIKEQLKNELTALHRRVTELETCEIDHIQMEESLQENERKLSTLMGNLPGMAYRCLNDENWTMEFISEGCLELTGYNPLDLIGNRQLSYNELIHPDDQNIVWNRAQESLAAKQPFRVVYRIQTATGEQKWVWEQGVGVFSEDGDLMALEGFITDITQRKRAEDAVRASERRYRTLLDFAPDPIVVFTLAGLVSYLNPAFSHIFGWTLAELEGKSIPYIPPGLQPEITNNINELMEKKYLLRHETKRLTKDGRVLDVVMRSVLYSESGDEPSGELVILKDITQQKRIARNNEAMRRISIALPEYPDLEELLDYISSEVKQLLYSEGALVILLDEESQELFFPGAAYDDTATQKRVKETRFHTNQIAAGKVIKTGEPLIVADTSKEPNLYPERDKKLGYHTKNLLLMPLKSSDRSIGVLCAINKKEGTFDSTDIELLDMIAGTVALSIENARFSEELKKAYREVTSLNRAKDKVISHLSHELKIPVSVLSLSLNSLAKKLEPLSLKNWIPTIERANRNLERLVEIQYEAEDIMLNKQEGIDDHATLSVAQCIDVIESLIEEEIGKGPKFKSVSARLQELFGPKNLVSKEIVLNEYVKQRLENLKPLFSHRRVEIIRRFEPTPLICIPEDPLQKIVDGLVKNAVENTPDEGKVEVIVQKKGIGTELVVHDRGVGITEEHKRRIFEGFFTTQDTMAYSSKRPFDFNAGGKGADLLRMKVFAARYNLKINMVSSRCGFIPKESDVCPGSIKKCAFCTKKIDCYQSGGTTFSIYFPPASEMTEIKREALNIL
jgi:PAS domain S-box-containing protein